MTQSTWLAIGLLIASLCNSRSMAQDEKTIDADVLLKGGTIFDGTGADGVVGDVALRGSKIVAVGKFAVGHVGTTIDCRGMVVAPGFIDLHNHSDAPIVDPKSRGNVNFLTQGCTTIVTGNCGLGKVDAAKLFEEIDSAGAGTNVIHLIPHGALRDSVFGKSRRKPTSEELAQMKQKAEEGMQAGAWGMSTGLIYVPGSYADTDELVELARTVAAHGGIYASHIRGEGVELLNAVREAIEIGQRAKLPVHVSHFKATGQKSWGSLKIAAGLIDDARKMGQVVTADQYPYIASSTSLEAMLIPDWAREGGRKALLARLNDSEEEQKIRAHINKVYNSRGKLVIASYKQQPTWIGKTLEEIAEYEGCKPVDIVIDIERHGGASAVSFGMNEDDVRYGMQLPWVATASDGSAKIPDGDRPHPRSFGTFPRKIGRYAIEEKVLPLSAAIRSASGLPADILGIKDRGYLRPETFADVVVFDPKQFRDRATFENPYQYSSGVRYVFVAGKPAVFDGTPTGALAGRALKKPQK